MSLVGTAFAEDLQIEKDKPLVKLQRVKLFDSKSGVTANWYGRLV